SIYLNKTLPTIELDLKQSLDYLRANTLPIIRESKEKWLLVKYNEAILGWVKNNRVNLKNYYPKNQRIISY
ncbi:MAG: tRNA/rRNA cytosine-C5-methylase, partial [Saprospiraceae bacterium]|nr:tRNA/rRNA cytosine-C5-methylase [Saprospiraceae bacterium]